MEFITEVVLERLRALLELDLTVDHTAEELYEAGMADLVRLFVKDEPHNKRKQSSKRWRLIMAISAADQIIERLLCDKQNKTEIRNWKDHPSAPGISLSDDVELNQFYKRVMQAKATGAGPNPAIAEADVTGWDWSVKHWELMYEAELRIALGHFSPTAARIIRARYYCVSHSCYAFPDGRVYALPEGGVQLSGCYNTSSTNSRLRVVVAMLSGASWAIAMGDDCLEEFVEDARESYARYGHPLKMYERQEDEFEFCSMLFRPDCHPHPVDGTKTLFRLLEQKTYTRGLLLQFDMEMRNHPRRKEFLEAYMRCDQFRSREGQQSQEKLHHAGKENSQET